MRNLPVLFEFFNFILDDFTDRHRAIDLVDSLGVLESVGQEGLDLTVVLKSNNKITKPQHIKLHNHQKCKNKKKQI